MCEDIFLHYCFEYEFKIIKNSGHSFEIFKLKINIKY